MRKERKGFTLMEMLVVIAVIALLVAIIIPAVAGSSGKAEAAANAANLRSVKSEIAAAMATGDSSRWQIPGKAGEITAGENVLPDFKGTGSFSASVDKDGNIHVSYDDKTIDQWAGIADGTLTPCRHIINGKSCTGIIENGICSNLFSH